MKEMKFKVPHVTFVYAALHLEKSYTKEEFSTYDKHIMKHIRSIGIIKEKPINAMQQTIRQ